MSERPLFSIHLVPGSPEAPGAIDISPKRYVREKLDMLPDEWEDLGKTITKATDLVRGNSQIPLDSGWRDRKSKRDTTWRIRKNT